MLTRIPEIGARLLCNIPRLEGVAGIVRYQRKNFDGSGFPYDGLTGEDIPFGARLLRIAADTLDLGRRGLRGGQALLQLQKYDGLYDPKLIVALLHGCESEPSSIPKEARAVRVRELRVGMTLACDVSSNQDVLLIAAGNAITPVLLERIRNFAEIGGSGIQEPILVID
jgi:hypothetical protein